MFFKQKSSDSRVVASVYSQEARFFHFDCNSGQPLQVASESIKFTSLTELEDQFYNWCRENQLKQYDCFWLIGRDSYQNITIDSPLALDRKIPEPEIREALKWQVKDSIYGKLDDILIDYYKPQHPDPNNQQVNVIGLDKPLVESIIQTTKKAGLALQSIEIEELALGLSLLSELADEKVIGYIGEDNAGLVFNFYDGDKLAFSRCKKGLFIPKQQAFSLESEADQNNQSFFLETQRTMDYVVGQLFRKPVDKLLIQAEKPTEVDTNAVDPTENNNPRGSSQPLAEMIQELLDIPVSVVFPQLKTNTHHPTMPSLAELGVAMGVKT